MPVLSGHDIILLTYADWHAVKSTPQHIARLLAAGNRVLVVDMPRSFLHFLKPADPLGGDAWEGDRLREVGPHLHIYHPPHRFLPVGHLPFQAARGALLANGRLLARQIRRAARSLGFGTPILWSFSPLHGGAVSHLPRRLAIHDICDEWSNYIGYEAGRRLVEWMDCRLARQAELVFVYSRYMQEKRAHLNPETHVVPPAGDVTLYATARLPETAVPPDLAALPRPRIGAICVVDKERFDVPLVAHLAKAQPGWSLAVLGPCRSDVDLRALRGLPNVHIMGNRPREDMPAYLKGFDAAIVPYALNQATRGIYPMKLQEYLAGGKPVVSPPFPECAHLRDVVYFADSPAAFADNIARALSEDTPKREEHRARVAAANGWEQRLEARSAHVERLLARQAASLPGG